MPTLRPHVRGVSRFIRLSVTVVLVVLAATSLWAHRVVGVNYPTLATALVQSPTASATDLPIPIFNTGLSVICFRVTNTSPVDANITAIGLELPGSASGYALVAPTGGDLRIYEQVDRVAEFSDVTLDFVIAAGANFSGGRPRFGIPPSTTPTTMCVSGPFNAATPIETLLNGVFVRFDGGSAFHGAGDIGVWSNRPR